VKNSLVGGLEDRQVKYLGPVHEGKKHDKKLCDEEGTRFPKEPSFTATYDREPVSIYSDKA
jgi:hypothetical protein